MLGGDAEIPFSLIEHRVPDFDGWKQAFNSDPAGRERLGVCRSQVLRSTDDPNRVMIDLEFNSTTEAEAFRHDAPAMASCGGQGYVESTSADR